MDILALDKISVDDMKAYYATKFPYEPNGQRVGRYAKSIGFRLAKQMVNRKYQYFYIRDNKS